VLGLLLCAFIVEFSTGGLARSIAPVPSDAAFRRIAGATWWVTPILVTGAGGAAAWELRGLAPFAAIGVLVLTAIGADLCWRWRPQRAQELRVPQWLAAIRASVRVNIRDAAAWRRQLVAITVGVALLSSTVIFS
jgi:hypothetical protein